MTDKILRRPQVQERTGLSRSTIYSMMADGLFPRPIRIGRKAVGWPESDIAAWLEGRKTFSETETAKAARRDAA